MVCNRQLENLQKPWKNCLVECAKSPDRQKRGRRFHTNTGNSSQTCFRLKGLLVINVKMERIQSYTDKRMVSLSV